jgi:hypothetical protein
MSADFEVIDAEDGETGLAVAATLAKFREYLAAATLMR